VVGAVVVVVVGSLISMFVSTPPVQPVLME
jgi:hypothetical protein